MLNGGCPKGWAGIDKVAWIDFRHKSPSPEARQAAETAVKEYGLDMSDFADFCPDQSQYD
ncbi:hypothetical protein L9F63_014830 [Diploptera punctata]|uniref:Uncharacterized protein n=1 Tax=Diploptera punctata TaxID=6984 RepID=A0AAD8EL83_DIPPU|nr:hypothetical protein L9F63_014830 [Diploptera punctata]